MNLDDRIRQHAASATLTRGDQSAPGLQKHGGGAVNKAVNREARTIDFVVSSAAVDRDGDVVEPSGWKLEDYNKNPVVLWGHNTRNPAVAKTEMIGIQGDKLIARAAFPSQEESAGAFELFQLYAGGYMRACSAGFRVLAAEDIMDEGGRFMGLHITSQELWEWSLVTIPANPEALMQAQAKGLTLDQWKGWAEEVRGEDWVPPVVADGLDVLARKMVSVTLPVGEATIKLRDGRLLTPDEFTAVSEVTSKALRPVVDVLKKITGSDVSNFPEVGDTKDVTLSNSNYERSPAGEAELLKVNWPSIWAKGTAEPIGLEPDADAIRRREKEAAAAREKDGISGVVDCYRLRIVHERGLRYMRDAVAAEKLAITEKARSNAPQVEPRDDGHRRLSLGSAVMAVLANKG